MSDFSIRPATFDDATQVRKMVRAARLNPRGIDWHNFAVAEGPAGIMGVMQVKTYPDGTREVASAVVSEAERGRGVGSALLAHVVALQPLPLYLMCEIGNAGWFGRTGFRRVPPADLPPGFRREYRIGRVATTVFSVFVRRRIRIVPMRLDRSIQ